MIPDKLSTSCSSNAATLVFTPPSAEIRERWMAILDKISACEMLVLMDRYPADKPLVFNGNPVAGA